MKLHRILVLTLPIAALAACGQGGGSGLSGPNRDAFIQSSTASCKQAATANPQNASLGADKIGQYCTCYSEKMADSISMAELEDLNKGLATDPAGAQAKLQPRIDAATKSCAQSVFGRAPG